MTKDEYTKRLEEILFDIANYAVQLPRQYPNHNYEPSDGMISGNVALFIAEYNEQAKQAIKQLMVDEFEKMIGEDEPLHIQSDFDKLDCPHLETDKYPHLDAVRQASRNILRKRLRQKLEEFRK